MGAPLESLAADVFAASPDHGALYLNESVEQTSAMILHAVRSRRGIVVLTGPSGTGKSTLLRHVAAELNAEAACTFLENPCETFDDLLEVICAKCGMTPAPDARCAVRLMRLGEHLLHSLIEDRPVVLFIDEAHLLPEAVLKQLRLLANLETTHEKLLQIVLCGQPSLLTTLGKPELDNLRERVGVWAALEPLRPEEVVDYVGMRFAAAGLDRAPYFRDVELRAIGKAALGVPRMINALCDHAVVVARTHGRSRVSSGDVARVIRRITGRNSAALTLSSRAGALRSSLTGLRARMRTRSTPTVSPPDLSQDRPNRLAWAMVACAALLVFAVTGLNFADSGALRSAWGRYVSGPRDTPRVRIAGKDGFREKTTEAPVLAGLDPTGGSKPAVTLTHEDFERSVPMTVGIVPAPRKPTATIDLDEPVGPHLPAATTLAKPLCGNSILDDGEECDDGNRLDTDKCLNTCREAVCGDGVVHEGVEACDDGNATNHDACLFGCALARCGDGYLRVGIEACDDGNDIEDDGCSTRCQTWFDLGSVMKKSPKN